MVAYSKNLINYIWIQTQYCARFVTIPRKNDFLNGYWFSMKLRRKVAIEVFWSSGLEFAFYVPRSSIHVVQHSRVYHSSSRIRAQRYYTTLARARMSDISQNFAYILYRPHVPTRHSAQKEDFSTLAKSLLNHRAILIALTSPKKREASSTTSPAISRITTRADSHR